MPSRFEDPALPTIPALNSRDETGHATIRAVRIQTPLRLDGRLDEEVYANVPAISGLIQTEPAEGVPATEQTEFWVLFDDEHVYVSFRCWDSQRGQIVANEMRRDHPNLMQNDYIEFLFDTFYDRRNAVDFAITPLGGRMDSQLTDERQWNTDWNPVWDLEVGTFERGWTLETAIPFKSLRYRPGRAQTWGFNVQRVNRRKNEISTLTRVPAGAGLGAIMRVSLSATLVGLEAPPGSRNLELKPYGITSVATDRKAVPAVTNDLTADLGLDAKYGITPNLTAAFTLNTDFAQVEADEQQVNLTRFSLFFPEKRDFFLEDQGMFAFGGVAIRQQQGAGDTPIMLYSRRIGLQDGREVPILTGGRLSGRMGRYELGIVTIRTREEPLTRSPATTFAAVRLRRDLLRRSSIGAIFTGRSNAVHGTGSNGTFGVDGSFAFYDHLNINTYWATTRTAGLSGDDASYRAQLDYSADRYGLQLEHLSVGDNFNPELGFVRRDDMRRSFGLMRFSPRPRSKHVRKLTWQASLAYVQGGGGRVDTREWVGDFAADFHTSDKLTLSLVDTYEFLLQPFPIADSVTVPVGGYGSTLLRAGFNVGQQRMVSANLAVERGSFYGGRKTAVSASRGRLKLAPQFSIEPSVSVNWVDLPQGAFMTTLVSSRVIYTMSPDMFVSALLQYNSSNTLVSANVRLRWEYHPGSELFVTYNEERDTVAPGRPGPETRAVVVKITRLFRF